MPGVHAMRFFSPPSLGTSPERAMPKGSQRTLGTPRTRRGKRWSPRIPAGLVGPEPWGCPPPLPASPRSSLQPWAPPSSGSSSARRGGRRCSPRTDCEPPNKGQLLHSRGSSFRARGCRGDFGGCRGARRGLWGLCDWEGARRGQRVCGWCENPVEMARGEAVSLVLWGDPWPKGGGHVPGREAVSPGGDPVPLGGSPVPYPLGGSHVP